MILFDPSCDWAKVLEFLGSWPLSLDPITVGRMTPYQTWGFLSRERQQQRGPGDFLQPQQEGQEKLTHEEVKRRIEQRRRAAKE